MLTGILVTLVVHWKTSDKEIGQTCNSMPGPGCPPVPQLPGCPDCSDCPAAQPDGDGL